VKGCKFFYKDDDFVIIHDVGYSAQRERLAWDDRLGFLKRYNNKLYLPCRDGYLEILTIQRPGKKALRTDAFLRGLSN